MLFFNLKASQKLIFSLFAGVVLFASCAGPKKVAVSNNTKNTSEKVTKNERCPGGQAGRHCTSADRKG